MFLLKKYAKTCFRYELLRCFARQHKTMFLLWRHGCCRQIASKYTSSLRCIWNSSFFRKTWFFEMLRFFAPAFFTLWHLPCWHSMKWYSSLPTIAIGAISSAQAASSILPESWRSACIQHKRFAFEAAKPMCFWTFNKTTFCASALMLCWPVFCWMALFAQNQTQKIMFFWNLNIREYFPVAHCAVHHFFWCEK